MHKTLPQRNVNKFGWYIYYQLTKKICCFVNVPYPIDFFNSLYLHYAFLSPLTMVLYTTNYKWHFYLINLLTFLLIPVYRSPPSGSHFLLSVTFVLSKNLSWIYIVIQILITCCIGGRFVVSLNYMEFRFIASFVKNYLIICKYLDLINFQLIHWH